MVDSTPRSGQVDIGEQGVWSERPAVEEMKGSGFDDRAKLLTEWFQAWNTCEQTIALYSLLSKVSATQARFLSLVLEHSLKNGYNSQELARLEKQANNAAFLSSLHSQTEDHALSQLLTHLPLLHPGNTEARKEYMKLLPKVLLGSSETQSYLDQCRQLLSLALVHPAFPQEDRTALSYWLKKLDEKHLSIVSKQKLSLHPSTSLPHKKVHQIKSKESSSAQGNGDLLIEGYIPVSNGHFDAPGPSSGESLPPSSLSYIHPLEEEKRVSLPPHCSLHDGFQLSSASKSTTLPARPSALASSAQPSDDVPEWQIGMKDVPAWLKSLRLHKYELLFSPLSYEEMLAMQESYLEKNNVTSGARKKIILSIYRLVKRPDTLAEIELDLEKHGRLLPCIMDLRQMLQTPIKPYIKPEEGEQQQSSCQGKKREEGEGEDTAATAKSEEKRQKESKVDGGALSGDEDGDSSGGEEEGVGQHSSSDPGSDLDELLMTSFPTDDLPSLISRAMGKAYSQLMEHRDTNEENLTAFIKLMDNALQHEAFTLEQKKLLFEWKQQCQQVLRVITPKKNSRGGRNWGAFTIAGMPSQSSRGSRVPNRSLRQARNGGGGMMKGAGLPTASRNSSTLPRMSPRTTGPTFPPHTFRPSSTIYPSSSPSQMNAYSKPFIPGTTQPSSYHHHPPPSSSCSPSSSSLPPTHTKPCDEASIASLARGVANYILDDTCDS